MAKYEFHATHGVTLAEHPEFKSLEKPGELVVWAEFKHAPELSTSDGEKRYAFATDDDKVAERVRAVEGYGITEVSTPAAPPAK